MHLNHLCFILPVDLDENESIDRRRVPTNKEHIENHAYRRFLAFVRKSLHHFCNHRWIGFCQDFSKQQKKNYSESFQDTPGILLSEKLCNNNPRIFSFSELYIGTNGFSEDEVLGSGGFGRVYRAVLPSDGTVVAVKCVAEKGDRIEKTFAAELMAVAQLRHRNLVKLRGWCVHEDQLLLVYDYMPNRSLDRVLFKQQEMSGIAPLSWERRWLIVSGLAAALFYIHEQLETQIIHRDVKTSNVMLDSHYNARLGDFGLARWLDHELEVSTVFPSPTTKDHKFRLAETTRIGGTIGYLSPESFQRNSMATAKSDVFSFGIVVLEVATGRRAVDLAYPDEQIVLLDWVRQLSDEGMRLQAIDHRLPEGSYRVSDMERLIHLGLLCSLNSPQSRPTMKWVVEALSSNFSGELPALPSFHSHPFYISLSSATTTATRTTSTTATSNSSIYATATGNTMFLTAENGENNSRSRNSCSGRSKTLLSVDTPQEISYKEIIAATNNFSEDRRVAELDFGTAYHGYLNNRHRVLVKRLGMRTCPALRARFSDELRNLTRLRHRNLVQLRGWCTEQGEMLVVYDYSACQLLSHLLFHHRHENTNLVLKWNHRYSIIKSLASAILYLHEEWDEQVIHRNVTSTAVILDPDMNPRLSCFALAEFLTRNEYDHHPVINPSRSVQGIFGYMSPEYIETGEAKTSADVYSFGVVVLEVVTGRMAVDFRRPEVLLVKKVHEFENQQRSLLELVDWRLDGEYDHKELVRLVKLGRACTHSDPDLRPSMRQIVRILDGNDKWLKEEKRKENREEWQSKNGSSLSLIRRIQALGIQ
ncbi:Protein kinase domain [Macleaya cordata]|uniref:Protein kinase domain n=1 Tax=Macleaya cordata TaxID=56857 RepID=A0A200PPB9_MACCD|nr:Protein kinase domain [Macleaya cordata]